MHNKCNALESSQNHPPRPVPWKNCLPRSRSLVSKRLGSAALKGIMVKCLWIGLTLMSFWRFFSTFVPLDTPTNLKEVLKLSEALAWSGMENQSPIHIVEKSHTISILGKHPTFMYNSGPQPFWHQGPVLWKTIFPQMTVGDGFRMIRANYIDCAPYFYYYYTVIYN